MMNDEEKNNEGGKIWKRETKTKTEEVINFVRKKSSSHNLSVSLMYARCLRLEHYREITKMI